MTLIILLTFGLLIVVALSQLAAEMSSWESAALWYAIFALSVWIGTFLSIRILGLWEAPPYPREFAEVTALIMAFFAATVEIVVAANGTRTGGFGHLLIQNGIPIAILYLATRRYAS